MVSLEINVGSLVYQVGVHRAFRSRKSYNTMSGVIQTRVQFCWYRNTGRQFCKQFRVTSKDDNFSFAILEEYYTAHSGSF